MSPRLFLPRKGGRLCLASLDSPEPPAQARRKERGLTLGALGPALCSWPEPSLSLAYAVLLCSSTSWHLLAPPLPTSHLLALSTTWVLIQGGSHLRGCCCNSICKSHPSLGPDIQGPWTLWPGTHPIKHGFTVAEDGRQGSGARKGCGKLSVAQGESNSQSRSCAGFWGSHTMHWLLSWRKEDPETCTSLGTVP